MVDTTALVDSDTLYIAAPGFLAFDTTGNLFVSDGHTERVVEYARSGRPVRVFGRAGRGPGELTGAGLIFLVNDSVLAAVDHMMRRINLFDVPNDSFLRARPIPGPQLYSAAVRGDTAWLGVLGPPDSTGQRAIAAWDYRTDSLAFVGTAPPEYSAMHLSPLLVFSSVHLEVWRDTIAAIYGASNDLVLLDHGGRELGRVDIPVRVRRGVPEARKRFLTHPSGPAIKTLTFENIQSSFSSPRLVHRLADGSIALVFADQTARGTLVTADLFVTVLSSDLRRACVDGPLPVSHDARPALDFRGDTIFTVEQVILPGEKTVTLLRGYQIDVASCEWVPTKLASGVPRH